MSKNDTSFNTPKGRVAASAGDGGRGGGFLRFSRPSRTVLGGGRFTISGIKRGVHWWQKALPRAEEKFTAEIFIRMYRSV